MGCELQFTKKSVLDFLDFRLWIDLDYILDDFLDF